MIQENLKKVLKEIPAGVKLVAVSKMNTIERIQEAYDAGQRVFGENRVQELMPKFEALPKDIEWHLIGHLQTNKVKSIAPFVSMIHSIDSEKLLFEVNRQARKAERSINVLLQFHVAQEDTKFGFTVEEAEEMFAQIKMSNLTNVVISGVMAMASNVDSQDQIRKEFQKVKEIFAHFKKKYFLEDENFKEISMGMSGDYQLAIKEGSTIVRVGSKIFK